MKIGILDFLRIGPYIFFNYILLDFKIYFVSISDQFNR